MKKHLFSQEGKFYKANLHCHTTVSDGKCTPDEIKRRYKDKGYSIVAFTDHICMVDHSYLNDDDFLALKGYELHIDNTVDSRTYHLNLIAKSPEVEAQVCFNPKIARIYSQPYIPFVKYIGDFYDYEYSVDCINDIIRQANENGFIVNYNHPLWSLQTYEDYGDLKGLYGVECYNGACVKYSTFDDNSVVYTQMLRRSPELIPIAADDNHNSSPFESPKCDSFRGFNMIKARSLSYEDVMDALLRGDTYASTGPLFYELYTEDGILKAKTSPVSDAALVTHGREGRRIRRDGSETFTEFEFELNDKNVPFRLEIIDAEGKRAYTRMYTPDEL